MPKPHYTRTALLASCCLGLAACGVPDFARSESAMSTSRLDLESLLQEGSAAAPQEQDGAKSEADMAAAAQNPIASNISLPFESTIFARAGTQNDEAYSLNIQPVIPASISDDWNLINRPIIPILDMPGAVPGTPEVPGRPTGLENEFGLGDINYTGFFSPKDSGEWIWGAGPSISLPTATSDELGSGKLSLGPSIVALTIQPPWLYGALWRQLWDVAGDSSRSSVNQMVLQPFANYNLDDGWYLHTSPVVVANWNAPSSDRWTVPIGGGVGKLLKIGDLPINVNLQYYYNVESPEFGPEWQVKFVFQFIFRK